MIARQGLLITLKHFRDVDYVTDINVRQDFGQVLEGCLLWLRLGIFLIDPVQYRKPVR